MIGALLIQMGIMAGLMWDESYSDFVDIEDNVWCYKQVCLRQTFKFSTNVIGKLAYSTCYVPFFIHELKLEI